MLSHYFKIFFHNLFRQKVITLINIIGLSVGMAVFILVSLYVKEEYSHEQRWLNSDRMVRTTVSLTFNGNTAVEYGGGSVHALEQMQEFFPDEVLSGGRVYEAGMAFITGNEELPGTVSYVDLTILDVFNFDEVSGSLASTLASPGQIALEEESANKLFPDTALGKSLQLKMEDGSVRDFDVTAIYRLPEGNGSIEFPNMTLLTEAQLQEQRALDSDWLSGIEVNTYLHLRDPQAVKRINARSEEFVNQYVRVPWLGADVPATEVVGVQLQALTDMYFNPLIGEEGGSRLTANSFVLVAVLVLLIAIINFVILSVARSAERVREVGVRKANGAYGGQLQRQFLFESFMQVVIAFCVALALYEILKPVFETLLSTELYSNLFSTRYLLPGVLLIALITFLGGMYPAFVLSSANPEQALKNSGSTTTGSMGLRKVLVGFQFTIAVSLIIATLVIYQQLIFVQNRDPGFDADQVVSLRLFNDPARANGTALMNAIGDLDGVDLVTPVSRVANSLTGSMQVTSLSRERGAAELADLYAYNVGYDFFSLYAMDILAGRPFSLERDPMIDRSQLSAEENRAFVTKVILNESAIGDFGFGSPGEAVGAFLYAPFNNTDNQPDYAQHEIIGVVADNQFDSLRTAPKGEMYRLGGTSNALLSFRVNEAAMATVKSDIERIWREVVGIGAPGLLFGREIREQEFAKEENEGLLLGGFALLAILVSCMGLYGLVAFDTVKRTKEIGMRKVLGGRQRNIQYLFLRQYFWPMLLANLIGWPLAVWTIQFWLENFPYQISQWALVPACVLAGLLVLVIAGTTLGATVSKAFSTKPAQALRYE